MVNAKINNLLIPNVTKLPSQKNVENINKLLNPDDPSEFKNVLDGALDSSPLTPAPSAGIHLSTHALKRLQERNLVLDKEEYRKLQTAMDRLKLKGSQDSLVVTAKAAYILDVSKNTIVTAIDKQSIGENVFTKIDSTILMD